MNSSEVSNFTNQDFRSDKAPITSLTQATSPSVGDRKRRATDEATPADWKSARPKLEQTMADDDWPSQNFRDHVINRLEPELARNRQNAPNLPVPGDARQVEEYVFQKCVSKDEYMRTIAKVINAINCNSKTVVVPPVVHNGNGQANTTSPGQAGNGIGSKPQVRPQVPPDPRPTHQRGMTLDSQNSRFQTPPLGQPPPVINTSQPVNNMVPPQLSSPITSNMPNKMPPVQNGPPHQYANYGQYNPQRIPNNQYGMPDTGMGYGMPHKGYETIPKVEPNIPMVQSVEQQLMQQQQRMWTPNGPADQLTGRPIYPNQMSQGIMNDYDLPPNIACNFKRPEDARAYVEKIRALSRYTNTIRNMIPYASAESAAKLQFAYDGITFRKYMSPENIKGIENFVQREITHQQPYRDNMNMNDQMMVNQPPMSAYNPFHGIQLAAKPMAAGHAPIQPLHDPTPQCSSVYGQPTQQPIQSGRPSPYPLPHNKMYPNHTMMPQHQQPMSQQPPNSSYQQYQQYNMPPQPMNSHPSQMPANNVPNPMNSTMNIGSYEDPQQMPALDTPNNMVRGYSNMMPQHGDGDTSVAAAMMKLPDQARTEFSNFEHSVMYNKVEPSGDGASLVVVCALKREQVPNLRVVVPRAYPNQLATVERDTLDLDAFYYDDLLNLIHEQINKAPTSVTDILNIWENTVMQYNSQPMGGGGFDDLLTGTNFGDIT
ncbi:unnamed protein product [Bursaphelenchus okinawaensis]|uniref:Mediator of RNA polymerase II transcription subunit 15 n=1 Tax=Bursaphelenchus okinawaensis TaxID=465554 RepID=A0A811KJF4_9BILA|nr:unnamed protein product [Bursaphelenchus okinawaensis]CAG9104156.1 unnamed protein product [Bursaphelenchus okinawaensis]